MKQVYLIGSLRNPKVPELANRLRKQGFNIFDDWYSPGEQTDDKWKEYEQARGRSFKEALKGKHAKNAFNFDKQNLLDSDIVVLVCPAGKSAHLELGWMVGQGRKGYILLEEDHKDRFDLMYQFATDVFETEEELIVRLKKDTSFFPHATL